MTLHIIHSVLPVSKLLFVISERIEKFCVLKVRVEFIEVVCLANSLNMVFARNDVEIYQLN